MTWKTNSRSAFLGWYQKTTDVLLDRMCCCSYLDAQVCGEARSSTYYRSKPTTLPTDWINEEESPNTSFHNNQARNPIHQDECCQHRQLTSVASKETTTTVLLADDAASFVEEEHPRREGYGLAPIPIYDQENSFIEEEGRFNCGMPPCNFQINDRRHSTNNRPRSVMKSPQEQMIIDGYSGSVLREVQQAGRANLSFLHTTQGIAC